MSSSLSKTFVLALICGTACFSANAVAHLTITPIYNVSDTTDFPGSKPISSLPNAAAIEQGINQALAQITNIVASPFTFKMVFLDDPQTNLAESQGTGTDTVPYSKILAGLKANTTKSGDDTTAITDLPAGPSTGTHNNATTVAIGGPNLMALGYTAAGQALINQNNGYAGYIGLNLSQMYVNRANANPDEYDIQSTVDHEVDELLGVGGQGSTIGDGVAQVGMLDLFRYIKPGVHSYNPSSNVVSYFSINGGKGDLVHFNQLTGPNGGDAGDWGDGMPDGSGNTPPQVQDAFGDPGVNTNEGRNEAISLDVVGYNLTSSGATLEGATVPPTGQSASSLAPAGVSVTAVPEPAEWVSLLMGGLSLLGILRRRLG